MQHRLWLSPHTLEGFAPRQLDAAPFGTASLVDAKVLIGMPIAMTGGMAW